MSKEAGAESDAVGAMCITLHRERSFHDVDVRLLKSAFQKYARRAMFSPKGVWCLLELDLFSVLETQPELDRGEKLTAKQIQMNAVRLRSNMINRLVAMMSEDVGPCQSQLPSQIHQLYQQWIDHRREESSRPLLVQLYHCLAREDSKRIRILSDLRTVYNLPEYLVDNHHLHRLLLEKFEMHELVNILYGDGCRGKTKQQLCEQIIEHLTKKSELAFAYLSVLFKRKDQTLIGEQLWPYLIRTSPFPDSTRALAFFYKKLKHKEHYLYLYHAMAFVVYEDIIRTLEQPAANEMDLDVLRLYREHLNPETKIKLDSFVFDRHTGEDSSRSTFALEGALVENQCEELYIDKYRKMYNEFKVMIDDAEQLKREKKKSKAPKRKTAESPLESLALKKRSKAHIEIESSEADHEISSEIVRLGYPIIIKSSSFLTDELANLAHGQRRTGVHKKAVFVSSDDVYKGSYLASSPADRKKLLHNLYFTRALLLLEEHLRVPDQHRSILDWRSIIWIEETDEYYLQHKSLGSLPQSEEDYEMVSTKVETNVKVLRRGSHVSRLIELEKDPTNFQASNDDMCQACIQHFYLRYLLNIGDSGTWNILVRRDGTRGICGIDFEEIRSNTHQSSRDPLTLLLSKVSKRQRELYGPYTHSIEVFRQRIDPADELAKTLSISFKLDVEQINARIDTYLNAITGKKTSG